jgi:co-chaperonin GroES (HSP10)
MLMHHDVDPKEALLEQIGDISQITLFHNSVLVAVYKRPEKTASGIILTDKARDEDDYQGKVGLILKCGPDAFQDDTGKWRWSDNVGVGSWIMFRPAESWSIGIIGDDRKDKTLCRILNDTSIKGVVPHPDMVW